MIPIGTKKTYILPSYDECVAICKTAGETVFYEKTYTVDGYKISTFNYMLAQYADFVNYKGYELRGLTFVFNLDGSLYKRFPLLRKFFNLNQVEETQLHVVKDLPFNSVYRKEDGSVISFFDLPNGRILAKSKMESDNVQAKMAYGIYVNDTNIERLVKYCLTNNITPIFELVSPKNRIVLKYVVTELILLRLRDNISGAYIDASELPNGMMTGIKMPEDFSSVYTNWTDLVEHVLTTTEEIEGYVVDCGDLIKIKTNWYCSLHHTLTFTINREDYLIEMFLDNKIDDLIAEIAPEDVEILEMIDTVIQSTKGFITKAFVTIHQLVNDYTVVYSGDRKEWAIRYKNEPLFLQAVGVLFKEKDIYELVVEYIKKHTNTLSTAREFVEKNKGLD